MAAGMGQCERPAGLQDLGRDRLLNKAPEGLSGSIRVY